MRERRRTPVLEGATGLGGIEIGDAVHRLLEQIDPANPTAVDVEQVREWYPDIGEEELARIGAYVENWCESELAARLAGLENVEIEKPFMFEHDGVVVEGRLDVLHRAGGQALVLDYKTNPLGDALPEAIVDEHYALQRLVYALACFRAGADDVEVAYAFVERADATVITTFTLADVPELEAGLSEAIRRIHAGEFVPTPSDWACSGCPALDVVCAGPRLPSRPRPLAAVG
jgi:ATP-dependent exoDNAse (exonuclease V) beta subunit